MAEPGFACHLAVSVHNEAMNRTRQTVLLSLSALAAGCLGLTVVVGIWLYAPTVPGTSSGLPAITYGDACVGIRAAPKLQVGAYFYACLVCSSMTPWMQAWPSKLCAQLPWPSGRLGLMARWGFEFPP